MLRKSDNSGSLFVLQIFYSKINYELISKSAFVINTLTDITLLIGVAGGDSNGMRETDKSLQATRSGGDGLSLTTRKASAFNGNQLYFTILKYISLVSFNLIRVFHVNLNYEIASYK